MRQTSGRVPAELSALSPGYLKTIPTCSAAGSDTYSASYLGSSREYTIYCTGHHHEKARSDPDFPQHTSREGLLSGESGPGDSLLATLFQGVRVILLGPAWVFFFVRLSQRPELMPQAQELEQKHPWLGRLLLCAGFTACAWLVSRTLCHGSLSALIAPLAGALAAEWVVRAGWYVWGKLSPVSHLAPPPISASQHPQLGASLRVKLRHTAQQRLLARMLKFAVPLAFLALLLLAPLVEADSSRDVFLGLALGALLSLPLYLWAQSWAIELFDRELELLPGSGILLEHARRWGQPTVRPLGLLAEVEDLQADRFRIANRTFLVGDREFLEALRLSNEH